MTKFNKTGAAPARGNGPLSTEATASTTTYEGGPGFVRDAKSELFLLAVANMVGEDTFYEKAGARDERYERLVHEVAVADPAWMVGFVGWLRGEANMRSASLVAAAEAVKARLDDQGSRTGDASVSAKVFTTTEGGVSRPVDSVDQATGVNRALIDAALQRADEPGEFLAYWMGRYGRTLPKPVKRGVADAVRRLYTQHCVSPETLVLRSDLRWVRADTLIEGDSLVGFDENIGVGFGRGTARFRTAVAEIVGRKDLESVRITTDRGVITVSTGHQFVARKGRNRIWKRGDEIAVGDVLLWLGEPWADAPDSRDVGYAAGLIDGEGWLTGPQGRQRVGFGQNPGFVWDEAVACFKRLGFEVRIDETAAKLKKLHISGGRYEQMRFLGQVRPARLIGRSAGIWEGGDLTSKGPFAEIGSNRAQVLAIEPLGVQPVVTMQTSTRTFIADGYLSHNSLLKYDTASHAVRFADVLDLCHPSPATPEQGTLFRYALDRRHGRDGEIHEALHMVRLNRGLRDGGNDPKRLLDPDVLRAAGMTWEDALSLAGSKVDKRKLWEALIPSMGYMALLRNLRNFDEAGVSDEVAETVAARLADPKQVAKSHQFPFRFLSAYEAVPSDRWRHPLGKALDVCLTNVPELPGRTLVLIDTSASMTQGTISAKSKVTPAKAAAVFGIVLAKRCGADVYGFADGVFKHELPKGASALREIERFLARTGESGHGTNVPGAIRATYAKHDRVVILSDMQTIGMTGYWSGQGRATPVEVGSLVPADKPLYGFNLQGYAAAAFSTATPNRYELGGMSDKVWQALPLLESGRDAAWPWM